MLAWGGCLAVCLAVARPKGISALCGAIWHRAGAVGVFCAAAGVLACMSALGAERKLAMSNVIVVGCGRVGSRLSNMLSDNGSNVCVIDRNPDAFANLGRGFNGATLQGVGFDEDLLMQAGAADCDVVAAVTQSDNANLMVAEVASRLCGVPHVIARLYNPDHERAYMQLGIDYVCGTSLVAEETFSKVVAGHGSHLDTFGEFEVLRFSLDLSWRDKRTIRVSEVERDHNVRIIAFERGDGSASSIPTKDSILYHGDTVLACVRHELIGQFSRYIQD